MSNVDIAGPVPSPERQLRLDGRVAILTGASAGLGHRFARVLAGAGARQVLVARRIDRLREVAAALPDAVAVQCDVSDLEAAQSLVEVALSTFGQLDVVINNAGIADLVPAVDETLETYESVLRLNLTAPFAISRRAAKAMLVAGTGGSIVNVASILGIVGIGQMPQAAYASSKAGLINLTRELAAQWARSGIRVNALCPGFFPSELTEDLFASDKGLDWVRRRTPMGRGGHEGELDAALLFLASDASSYVTGQTLVVDGGWTAV